MPQHVTVPSYLLLFTDTRLIDYLIIPRQFRRNLPYSKTALCDGNKFDMVLKVRKQNDGDNSHQSTRYWYQILPQIREFFLDIVTLFVVFFCFQQMKTAYFLLFSSRLILSSNHFLHLTIANHAD